MASKLPKIPQSTEEKAKNAADTEQHAALVDGGAVRLPAPFPCCSTGVRIRRSLSCRTTRRPW